MVISCPHSNVVGNSDGPHSELTLSPNTARYGQHVACYSLLHVGWLWAGCNARHRAGLLLRCETWAFICQNSWINNIHGIHSLHDGGHSIHRRIPSEIIKVSYGGLYLMSSTFVKASPSYLFMSLNSLFLLFFNRSNACTNIRPYNRV